MPQPRIDMRVIKEGVKRIRYLVPLLGSEDEIEELADELDDREDGATILVALTPRECEVIIDAIKHAWLAIERNSPPEPMPYSTIVHLDPALEELSAALRGVVVQPGV